MYTAQLEVCVIHDIIRNVIKHNIFYTHYVVLYLKQYDNIIMYFTRTTPAIPGETADFCVTGLPRRPFDRSISCRLILLIIFLFIFFFTSSR